MSSQTQGQPTATGSIPFDRSLVRVAAWLLIVGVLIGTLGNVAHPSQEDPMDNPQVFQEYADSDIWITAHLAQFFGYALTFAGLVAVSHTLAADRRRAAVPARLALAVAISGLAVAAVLQGVDGVALKAMVDRWADAAGTEKALAFSAAESVRWTEIGINSLFRLLQGATFLLAGLALVLDGRWPRWLGWIGMACGAAVAVRGVVVAFVGFDMANPVYLATGLLASNFPLTLLNVWMAALAINLWSRRLPADLPEPGQ